MFAIVGNTIEILAHVDEVTDFCILKTCRTCPDLVVLLFTFPKCDSSTCATSCHISMFVVVAFRRGLAIGMCRDATLYLTRLSSFYLNVKHQT